MSEKYISQFKGEEIDSRLAQIPSMEEDIGKLNTKIPLIEKDVEKLIDGAESFDDFNTKINSKPGLKVFDSSGGVVGEIFNDYESNIASGEFSTASGRQSIILNKVSISEQEITYISYANNILTLSAANNFFDTANLWGFRIFNINTDEISDSTVNQSDVVKVKKSIKNTASNNWQFEIETPINSLNLNNPNQILILAILNGNETYNTGEFSHVEGWGNLALGNGIHTEGIHNIAEGETLHVEGAVNKVNGKFSHAEGANTIIEGDYAHTEGFATQVLADFSHAEGYMSQATAAYSHAEGYQAKARGAANHAEGEGTVAILRASHVQGKFNIVDKEEKYAHIVGWGKSNTNRKNIHTIDTNGNAMFAGNITFNYNNKTYNLGKVLSQVLKSLENIVDGNEVAY